MYANQMNQALPNPYLNLKLNQHSVNTSNKSIQMQQTNIYSNQIVTNS